MNNFTDMYNKQCKFTDIFFKEKYKTTVEKTRKNSEQLVHWTKEYILSLIKEATELLDECDWKTHTPKLDKDISDNFLEEGVDVLKYLLGLLYIHGFSASDIEKKFFDKSNVVEAKFKQAQELDYVKNNQEKLKIAAIDIDGVLAEWDKSYLEYVNKISGIKVDDLSELGEKFTQQEILKLKESFRLSGRKQYIDVCAGSVEFMEWLKNNNYYIILLTARPYQKYFRIYNDTLVWLKKNRIPYNFIIWEKEKEKFLINHFNNISFVVDDKKENILTLKRAGFTVFEKNNNISWDSIIKKIKKLELNCLSSG